MYVVTCVRILSIGIYTTLAWALKGTTQSLTRIFPRKYLDIYWAMSWEHGLLMALMPNQFIDIIRFDSLY